MEFRKKSRETLEKQIKDVERSITDRVIPVGKEQSSLLQLKEEYPARYNKFIELLRAVKNPFYISKRTDFARQTLKILNNLEDYLSEVEEGKDRILIPRQLETFQKIHSFLESGQTEGHVTLPTGIGKTVIFSKFIEAATKNNLIKGLVIGPTKIILHQNRWKMETFGEIDAGAFYGFERDLSKQVTVTTYASLRNGIKTGRINPSDYSFLILDEAHRALGEETVNVIEEFPKETIKLGFTATPEFHEDKSVVDILPVTIDELSVREAIEENLLAGLKVYLFPTKQDISKVERKGKEYAEDALEKIINTPERNSLVVNVYKANPRFYGKKAVVYCNGRQHGKDMTTAFLQNNIPALYIDGETDEFARENIFDKFKRGEVNVLCNAQVLIEGFDEPEAEICINAVPTLSRVVAEQRGGRVLRRSRLRDDKIGNIVEIIDEIGKSENTPVLFSEIAGAAEILPKKKEEEKEKIHRKQTKREKREKKPVEITATIVDNPDVIMELTNRNMRQRFYKMFEYSPKEWVHPRQLARECKVKESEIRNFAEKQKETHPEWFKKYLTATDILTTHYDPKLVDLTRRQFLPDLEDKITAREFAQEYPVTKERAAEMLKAAESESVIKPARYGTTAYYPKREYLALAIKEEQKQRTIEDKAIKEAEELFWNDDERTDDERERDYWETFDDISLRKYDEEEESVEDEIIEEPEQEFEIVEFIDEIHQPFVIGDSIQNLSNEQRNRIFKIINYLPFQENKSVIEYYIEGRTQYETAKELKLSHSRVGQLINSGIKMLQVVSDLRHQILDIVYDDERLVSNLLEFEETKEVYLPNELKKLIKRYRSYKNIIGNKK